MSAALSVAMAATRHLRATARTPPSRAEEWAWHFLGAVLGLTVAAMAGCGVYGLWVLIR